LNLYHALARPLQDVDGIGPKLAQAMTARGVANVGELLLHLPTAWVDDRHITPMSALMVGQIVRVQGVIVRHHAVTSQHRLLLQICDDNGSIHVTFFHAKYLYRDARLQEGQTISLRGEVALWQGQLQMTHPDWQAAARFEPGIKAHYPMLAGKGDRTLQRLIAHALALLPQHGVSPLDRCCGERSLCQALHLIHHPPPDAHAEQMQQAKQRIKQEELLVYAALLQERKKAADCAAPVLCAGTLARQLHENFAAPLTTAQQQACIEIDHDLQSGRRMHRLLQGDVGSGKTWVAALAMAQCLDAGYQAVLMAPTTILAVQHEQTLAALFAPLGVDVALLTGNTRASERKKTLNRLHSGTLRLLIGTHALLRDDVQFLRLGLAIVDEQHRFGVRQRWALTEKDESVHLLAMSATPIPRTLALGLYNDLAMTVMRGMPAGRLPVETRVLSAHGRGALAAGIQRLLDQNAYCYWITPRIDDDDVSVVKRAEALHSHFPHAGVQALHGRMKATEKNQVLADFAAGRCRLLVATTVVEVGVNIPEARLIIIEDADHYGLAQLHQLRGRVGRSNQQAYCVLLPAAEAAASAVQRLQHLVQHHDGLKLAELDLALRGSGDTIGVQQSGIVGFRVLDSMEDAPLIRHATEQDLDVNLVPEMRNFWRPVNDAVD